MDDRILKALQHADPNIRRKAINAAAKSQEPAYLRPLFERYQNESDPTLRELARKAAGYLQDHRADQAPRSSRPDNAPVEDQPAPAQGGSRGWVAVLLLLALLIAGGGVVAALVLPTLQPADARLLFVGNSFTHYHNLWDMTARLVTEAVPEWERVESQRVAPGGYTIAQHTRDAETEGGNVRLRNFLLSGSAEERDWDLVVIQGQSQIIGFDDRQNQKAALLDAAPRLVGYASDTGAMVLLYQTWGYFDGDARNDHIYPDYMTMQTHLVREYDQLADGLHTVERPVYVAPVGLSFRLVYEDLQAQNENPVRTGTRFHQLYDSDHRHPSLAGSYLAASVIAATYTGYPMAEVNWVPGGLDADFAAYLRQVADRLVSREVFAGRRYPPPLDPLAASAGDA